jgi:hypothetical protein
VAEFYTEMAELAEDMIDEFGRDVDVVRQAKTAADPTKPWRTTPSPVTATVSGKAVFVSGGSFGKNMNVSESIKRADTVALFAANNDDGYNLEFFDVVVDDDDVTWQIVRAELLKPGATRLLYMFEVKR